MEFLRVPDAAPEAFLPAVAAGIARGFDAHELWGLGQLPQPPSLSLPSFSDQPRGGSLWTPPSPPSPSLAAQVIGEGQPTTLFRV